MAATATTCAEGGQKVAEAFRTAHPNVEFTLLIEELAADELNPVPPELSDVSEWADVTEAGWTGFARVSKALPVPVDGGFTITSNIEWSTGAATDGPAFVGTIAAILPTTNELLALWDADFYLEGPTPVALNVKNAVARVTQPLELFLSLRTLSVP